MGSYFPKQWSLSYLNLTVLSNIYLRVKFDLVSCSFNSTDRRHVNIVDLSPGGGVLGNFPYTYAGSIFGVKVSNFGIFGGVTEKKMNIFWGRQFLWIFLGGSNKN